jgi:hypothetical protein
LTIFVKTHVEVRVMSTLNGVEAVAASDVLGRLNEPTAAKEANAAAATINFFG